MEIVLVMAFQLIICAVLSKGGSVSLSLISSSSENEMNLEEFIKARKMIQGLDSFPSAENVEVKPHRIVKKQMAPVDGPVTRKNKRSLFTINKNLSKVDGQDDKKKDEKTTAIQKGDDEKQTYETEISIKPKNLNYEEKLFKIRVSLSKNINWRDNIEGFKDEMSPKSARQVEMIFEESTTPLMPFGGDANSDTMADEITFGSEVTETSCEDTSIAFSTRNAVSESPITQKCVTDAHCKKEGGKSSKEIEVIDNLKHYVGRFCKRYDRYPDNADCHYFYECEVQPDGCLKLIHKKCPEGEIFYNRHLECLKFKFVKMIQKPHRQKRHSLLGSERKFLLLDTGNEGDIEPSNEWIDASKSGETKIPSEFKPAPKPVLRVFHLQCKRQHETIPHHSAVAKHKMFVKRPMIAIHPKLLRLNRPLARSVLVKVRKKDTKSVGDSLKKTTRDEEDEESDEDDDEEENESGKKDEEEDDDEYEEKDDKKATSEKIPEKQRDNIKELFKTSKDAVSSKVNFKEESSSLKGKSSPIRGPKPVPDKSKVDEDKKVLVDANIRVDSSLGNILKGLFSSNTKEKTVEKKSSGTELSKLIKEQKIPKKESFEYLSAYQNLILSNPKLFKHYMSTVRS